MSESDEMKNYAAFEKWWKTKIRNHPWLREDRSLSKDAWNAALVSIRAESDHSPDAGEMVCPNCNNGQIGILCPDGKVGCLVFHSIECERCHGTGRVGKE